MTLAYPELERILRGFALLLHSGIGGADGAFLLAKEEQPPLQQLLNTLGEALDKGTPLSEAMEISGVFPEHTLAMVYIGEETGRLEEALNTLADYYEERSRSLLKIRSAIAYPALVLVLMLLVIGVLLVKVLPIFDQVYASLGSRLTGPAAGLLYAGQLLEGALPALFVVLVMAAVAVVFLKFSPTFRRKLTSAWQRKYGDRGIARKFNNARFARALAMGLSSGLNLDDCMVLAEKLLQDIPAGAKRCADCAKAIEAGTPFGNALEHTQLLPAPQCRLLQLGQRSGSADQVMQTIADTMMEEAQNNLDKAISAIEPILVLVTSLLVGLILLSVMVPLADILTVLG